jgi:hypothetical protein
VCTLELHINLAAGQDNNESAAYGGTPRARLGGRRRENVVTLPVPWLAFSLGLFGLMLNRPSPMD